MATLPRRATMSKPQPHPHLQDTGAAADHPAAPAGLVIAPARTLGGVVEAWQLVYIAYRRAGLIAPNHQRLYTLPHAVSPKALVVHAHLDGQVISTLTAVPDGPAGLPLDARYAELLAGLRRDGRRLLEICLVGDRRQRLARTLQLKRGLMRLALGFAPQAGSGDVVTLATAEEADLYRSEYGFEVLPADPPDPPSAGRGRVVLLLNLAAAGRRPACPPGLAWCRRHPVPAGVFRTRFDFDPGAVRPSPLGAFLTGHAHALSAPDAPPYGTPTTAA
jgi:hypothetical protein